VRKLPLYSEPQLAPVETASRTMLSPGACERCTLHEKAQTICMGADGEPDGVLVVGDGPGRNEDSAGRPFVGEAGRYLRQLVKQWWHGPIALDNATRCFAGRSGITDKAVDECRGFLAQTIHEVRPTRIIALGPWASYSVLGRNVSSLSARRGYGWLVAGTNLEPVPVFLLLHPLAALRNRFVRQWFEADLKWALTTDVPVTPPWSESVRVVTDASDLTTVRAELLAARWSAYDVETAGYQWEPGFQILCASLCAAGSRSPWLWDRAALADVELRQGLIDLLTDPAIKLLGQNVKYDNLSVRSAWGAVPAGMVGDTRLWRKLLDPEAAADLETMAELVGMGGHKAEAQAALKDAGKAVQRARRDGELGRFNLDPATETLVRLGGAEIETRKFLYAYLPESVLLPYNARDTVATTMLGEKLEAELRAEPPLLRVWDEVVSGAAWAVEQVETWGVPVDVRALELFDQYLAGKIDEITRRFEPGFNPNSSLQVRDLLYKKLGLTPHKLTDKGSPSTDAETLEALRGQHPIAGDIVEYRTFTKLKGTYAAGMLAHVRTDGRIHPNLKLDGARSGRLSCTDPNLQNIPRGDSPEGKMARDVFVASPGYVLLQADYSQIELRVAAMLSGDVAMIDVFKSGQDFHQRTAEMVSQMAWGIPPEQVEKRHRSAAKIINFGLLYGKSDRTLAKDINCKVEEATRVREAIFGRFKKLASWMREQLRETKATGYTWTWWNGQPARRRSLYQVADGDDEIRSRAEHGSWNTPIQGTATEYCTSSLVEVVRWVLDDAVPARVLLPVHDALLIEVREDVLPEAAYQVRRIMQSWYSAGVPLVVDLETGPAWGSLTKYKLL